MCVVVVWVLLTPLPPFLHMCDWYQFSIHVLVCRVAPPRSRDSNDSGDFHQRLCLRAAVRTFVGLTHVFVTHLSLSQAARVRTLPEIAGAVLLKLLLCVRV